MSEKSKKINFTFYGISLHLKNIYYLTDFGMILVWIIVAIIMFSLIILIHEWGHFSAARKFGVTVEEFGLWIPPRAKKIYRDNKWTDYTINWLPIWGFVKLKWESAQSLHNKNDPTALVNKPWYQQSIIILAGVFMNFVLASLIFAGLFIAGVQPLWINSIIPIESHSRLLPNYQQAKESGVLLPDSEIRLYPSQNSLAEKAGLLAWDRIISVVSESNGTNSKITTAQELIDIIASHPNTPLTLNIERDNTVISLNMSPQISTDSLDNRAKIWAWVKETIRIDPDFSYQFWIWTSLWYWVQETYAQAMLTFKALSILLQQLIVPDTPQQRSDAISQVSGPIGIVDFISNSLSGGIKFLLIISAIISINLGVFNLLPIPALDGGRFIFISINAAIRKIFGKQAISANIENMIHLGFFVILIILSILIAYNDILKILQ